MIPVGIERDKQIDKLRGDSRNFGIRWTKENGLQIGKLSNPWSTDIILAMKLLDEMRDAVSHSFATLVEVSVTNETARVLLHMNGGLEVCHYGDTMTDAISGAWLKWKDNSQ